MNVLSALLWKEGREILPKVLVAVALAAVVCLLRTDADFNRSYVAGFDELITGCLVVMAVVLAMDAVARERSTGTWPFLLGKPVASAMVLAVKFSVGLGGLLLVALAAWATVYIDVASLEMDRTWLAYKLVTVQRIDYASMVALSFAQFSLLYALVFIGSAVTDHPFKAVAVGIALAVLFGVFFTGPATTMFPLLNRYPLVTIGLDEQGHLVRLATDAARFWVKVLANVGLAVAGLAMAAILLRRLLSWRAIALWWGALMAVVVAIFYGGSLVNQRTPDGVLKAPDKQHYDALVIQGGLAYMTTGNMGLAIADLSDPQHISLLGSARPASDMLWKGSNALCVIDSLAYLVGARKGLPSDSLGVVVFDVSDPAAPTLKGSRMFAALKREKFRYQQYWGVTDSGLLLVRERGDALVAEAFALDAEGMPVVGAEQVIMPIADPVDDAHRWKRRCQVRVRGHLAYIRTESELVVLDVADVQALRETGRHTLASFQPQSAYDAKLIATDGDKLYVERLWPHELVEFDISNPEQPREVGYVPLPPSDDIRSLQVADNVAYSLGYASDLRVKVWTIAEYGALIERFSLKPDWSVGALSVANGYLYATSGGGLLAYRLD